MQQIKLYDLGHFEHILFDGFYEIGRTIYNVDNRSKRIIKNGKAPCLLLDCLPFWFTMDKVEQDLRRLGFTQKDEIVWTKREENGNRL